MVALELLDQAEIWVDGQGHTHRIDEMDGDYRANVLRFLRRNATKLHDAAMAGYMMSSLANVPDPSDGVWEAQEAIEADLDRPTEDWIETRPLVRRLVELDADRSRADRRRTRLRNWLHRALTGYREVTFR